MTILIFCVALLVGIILGYFFGKRGITNAEKRAEQNIQQLVDLSNANSSYKKQVEMLEQQVEEEKRRSENNMQRLKEEFRQQQAEQEQRFKDAEAARRAESKAQLEQQLELVKTQLSQQTEQSNRESITEIMRPYREQLEQLKQQNVEDRTSLQSEIKRFVETGGRLTREADRLVTALSGSVTIQGNLGEKLLSDLLAGSGLIEGKQYQLQKTVRNEDGTTAKNSSGKKMRPDAALIYPETNSILYIDSKFQLPSDLDFENLEAENQRAVLKSFAEKIADQAKKLSDRNYDRTCNEGYTPLPYVIMFVPSETALMAVTNFDRSLWQRIFSEHGVFLASERNLLVLIEMVRYMWQRQVAIDNHEEIIKRAELVLDRVIDFMTNFDTVESSINEAKKAISDMRDLAATHGHSIEVAVRNLAQLGVKPTKVQKKKRPEQLAKIEKRANYIEGVEIEDAEAIEEVVDNSDTTAEE